MSLLQNTGGDNFKYITIYLNEKFCNHLLVTSTQDTRSAACGTLRHAITYANENNGFDTITFRLPALDDTIHLFTTLYANEPFAIIGPGKDKLTLNGNNNSIFHLEYLISNMSRMEATGDTTYISGLSFVNSTSDVLDEGGGLTFKGADKTLILQNCAFENNSSYYGGGALWFQGQNLKLDKCTFHKNYTTSDVGNGGGVRINASGGSILITNSLFDQNYGLQPAAGYVGKGHGVYLEGQFFNCRIENSTFSFNIADVGGAVFYSNNFKTPDSLTIVNSTFSGNIGKNGGGAIYTIGNGKTILQNSTFTQNGSSFFIDKDAQATVYKPSGGAMFVVEGKVSSYNTILAGNKGSLGNDIYLEPNSTGTFTSLGGNLIGIAGNNGKTLSFSKSDKIGDAKLPLDPLLSALSFYGGFTPTHYPLENSPVINSALPPLVKQDQRGFSRVAGVAADIGAVENDGSVNFAYAGKDSTLCDTIVTLKASTPKGFKGYWRISKGSTKGIIKDSTQSITTARLSVGTNAFIWTITNGTIISEDEVLYTRNPLPNRPRIQTPTEACSPTYILNHLINNTDSRNSYQWTKISQNALDTLKILKVESFSGNLAITVSTTVTNYKEGNNTLYLTTSNGLCSRVDSTNLLYYPNEVPVLGKDVTTYEPDFSLTIQPVMRNKVPLAGYWRVASGTSTIKDTNVLNLEAINLSLKENKFEYHVKNFCKTSNTIIVTRETRISYAEAGPDHEVCSNKDTLSATLPINTLTGAWRSKNKDIKFSDSTRYNTTVEGLPKGSNKLYWVVKAGTQVQSIDSVVVTNNQPSQATIIPEYINTCNSFVTLTATSPTNNERGLWSKMDTSNTAQIVNIRLPTTSVTNLEIFNTKTRDPRNVFIWRIVAGRCESSDTVSVYSARNLAATPIDTVTTPGSPITIPIEKVYTYSLGDTLVLKGPWNHTAIDTAYILNGKVVFKTNSNSQSRQIIPYTVSNRCVSINTSITIETYTIYPAEKKRLIEMGGVLVERIPISEITTKTKVDYVEILYPLPKSGVIPKLYLNQTKDTIIIEANYATFPDFADTDYILFRVCSGQECYLGGRVVVDFDGDIVVYNAISPNGDGKHDVFEIKNIHKYSENTVQIFNRWGDKIYSEKGYNNTTTAFDGENLPDGTYYYVLSFGTERKPINGYFILKR